MKKNFTVNISGTIFHIDNDAFQKLDAYLNNIKKHFRGTDGADEIYNDIEARIAGMLHERTGKEQVVSLADITEVIGIMGQPFEFEGSEDDTEAMPGKFKRLYRSIDDKYLGGVCGGLGAYFNLDPIWFRILFVIITMAGGAGVLIYLILWIALPLARTTAEKLEMKGQSVNISNIENSIRDEFSGIKEKFNDFTKSSFSGTKKKRR